MKFKSILITIISLATIFAASSSTEKGFQNNDRDGELVISDILVQNLTSARAAISWSTNIPAGGYVEWAEGSSGSGYTNIVYESYNSLTLHSVVLEAGLNLGVTYVYRIYQEDETGVYTTYSDEYSFTLELDTPLVTDDLPASDYTGMNGDYLYITNEGGGGGGTDVIRVYPDGTASVWATGFNGPSGLAIHPSTEDLWVSDDMSSLYRVPLAGSMETMFAGMFSNPNALAFDIDENLLVADAGESVIRVDLISETLETLAEDFSIPQAVGVFGDDIYFTDYAGYIYRITTSHVLPVNPTTVEYYTSYPVVPYTQGGMAIDSGGNIYVSGYDSGKVYRVNTDSSIDEIVQLDCQTRGLALNNDESYLFVTCYDSQKIIEVDLTSLSAAVLADDATTGGLLYGPFGMILTPNDYPGDPDETCDDADCDDSDPCTDDYCDEYGICVNEPIPDCVTSGCEECDYSTEADCSSDPACFWDMYGDCMPVDPYAICPGYADETDCEMDIRCDWMWDGVEYLCKVDEAYCGEPDGCTDDMECNDDDPCTIDYCDGETGSCYHEPDPLCADPCEGVMCDDGDPCTMDYCDALTGGCIYEPIPDCVTGGCEECDYSTEADCSSDPACFWDMYGDCMPVDPYAICPGYADETACEMDIRCDWMWDGVEYLCKVDEAYCGEPDGCTEDLECNDGDPCTIDYCDGETGSCYHEPDPLCTDPCEGVMCDDGDPCTMDYCDALTGGCIYEPIPDCVTGGCEECDYSTEADCSSDPACFWDMYGDCMPVDPYAICPGYANETDCEMDIRCDWMWDGVEYLCKVDEAYCGEPDGCTDDMECNDGDPCTIDYCDGMLGNCVYEPVPGCEPGPGECEDPATDFDDLTLGNTYYVSDVFYTGIVEVFTAPFNLIDGSVSSAGETAVEDGGNAGGSGLEMRLSEINLDFNFGGPVNGLKIRFGEYGGNVNLIINGVLQNVDDFAMLNGMNVGGVDVHVFNGFGNDMGGIELCPADSAINMFVLGGQELWIDDICLTPCSDVNFIPGDINNDGAVDVIDIVTMVGIILGGEATPYQMMAGDMNNDGELNVMDIVELVGIILNGSLEKGMPLNRSSIRVDDHKININIGGSAAGIQLYTRGDYTIIGNSLPFGWEVASNNETVVIYNMNGLSITGNTWLEYSGNLVVESAIAGDWDGNWIEADIKMTPESYGLQSAYPNPFNPVTTIDYSLQKGGITRISIYNLQGMEVALLYNQYQEPGNYQVSWNASGHPSGIYLVRLYAPGITDTQKLLLVK